MSAGGKRAEGNSGGQDKGSHSQAHPRTEIQSSDLVWRALPDGFQSITEFHMALVEDTIWPASPGHHDRKGE